MATENQSLGNLRERARAAHWLRQSVDDVYRTAEEQQRDLELASGLLRALHEHLDIELPPDATIAVEGPSRGMSPHAVYRDGDLLLLWGTRDFGASIGVRRALSVARPCARCGHRPATETWRTIGADPGLTALDELGAWLSAAGRRTGCCSACIATAGG